LPQILFKKAFKAAILEGRKTTTLRRWRTCSLKAGDRVNAPGVGQLILKEVRAVTWETLTEADAQADGFASLAELNRVIRRIYPDLDRDGKTWFRIRFRLARGAPRAKRPASGAAKRIAVPPLKPMPANPLARQLAVLVRMQLDKAVRGNGS